MNSKKPFWIYGSLVAAMIFWSLTFIWFKIANEVYPPFTIVFLRLVISAIVLLLISWFAGFLQKIRKKDYKWILLMVLVFEWNGFITADHEVRAGMSLIYLALFGSTAAFILYNFGIKQLGASRANIFTNIIPALTAIFAYFILKEEMTWQKVTGIAIVLAGLFLSQLRKSDRSTQSPHPNL